MTYRQNDPSHLRGIHRGFTLVEMMVATALVVLMMLMFAQIFQTAGGLVSNQKGMAHNDQNERTLTILLRGDIDSRTFRDVVPFRPGDQTAAYDSIDRRQGFFSLSENDPLNATDDVLHLTIKIDEKTSLPLSGKTSLLRRPAGATPAGPIDTDIDTPAERDTYLYGNSSASPPILANSNQPEFDDGQIKINGTGSSTHAEVCWFLRNGVLYRRQLLIRRPYAQESGSSDQPEDANFNAMIEGNYSLLNLPPNPDATPAPNNIWQDSTGRFWYDFDYSAFNDPVGSGGNGLTFHSFSGSMKNEEPPANTLGAFPTVPPSLGIPCLRFGNSLRRALDASTTMTTPINAIAIPPKEFLTASTPSTFIGRFTVQETAHSGFTYPSQSPTTGGPFQAGTALTLATNGLVSEFSDENGRRGEDIVMTNVHSFDIQVWDDGLPTPAFVNLNNGGGGHYGGPPAGPFAVPAGNRYDTWHPNTGMPAPPYRPTGTKDLDGDGVTDDPGLGSINEIPLKAIRIQIRFYDEGSGQMRDFTFTRSLISK